MPPYALLPPLRAAALGAAVLAGCVSAACAFDPAGLPPIGPTDGALPPDGARLDAGPLVQPPLGVSIPERPGLAPAQTVNRMTAPDVMVTITLPPTAQAGDEVYLRVFPTGESTPIVELPPVTHISPGGSVVYISFSVSTLPDGLLTLEAWMSRTQDGTSAVVSSQARKDTLLQLAVDPVVTPIAEAEDRLSGLTEPDATVIVSSATLPLPSEVVADHEGFFAVPLALPLGLAELSVTATDAAWNRLTAVQDRRGRPLAIRRLATAGPVPLRDESSRLGLVLVGSPCAEGAGAAFTFLREPALAPGGALVPDLFVTCLNQAFANDGTGHFALRGLGATVQGQRAAALGDFDNDGDWDLAVTRSAGGTDVFLYRNLTRPLGGQGFGAVSWLLGGFDAQNPEGLAFLDADADGWLDLFVQEGNAQRLFRNNGLGSGFAEEATARGLLPVAGLENGHWVVASDFDQDGDVDLVVADDTGPGFLFENLGGLFEDRTAAQGLVFAETAKRDLEFGDLDASGSFDLFVPQGGAAGENALLAFTPGAGFADVAALAGVSTPPADNGAAWGDLDLDGRLDLLYTLAPSGGVLTLVQQLNRGDLDADGVPDFETFTLEVAVASTFAPEGVLLGDVDDDGDLDVLVVSRDGAHLLLVNAVNDPLADDDLVQNPRSLRVLLVGNGVTSNRSALGAVLRVRACGPAGALLATREVNGGRGNGGQSSPVLHLGGLLPSACVALEARFVGGPPAIVQVRPALLPGQTLVLFQP